MAAGLSRTTARPKRSGTKATPDLGAVTASDIMADISGRLHQLSEQTYESHWYRIEVTEDSRFVISLQMGQAVHPVTLAEGSGLTLLDAVLEIKGKLKKAF